MKKYIYLFLSVAFMVIIFMFSSQTAETSGAESVFITEKILRFFTDTPSQALLDITETVFRKLCHFCEYAVLCILWYKTLRSFGCNSKKSAFSIIICVLYAISDEIHQYFVPGRACRLYDVFIDSFGGCTGYFVFGFIEKHFKKKITKD